MKASMQLIHGIPYSKLFFMANHICFYYVFRDVFVVLKPESQFDSINCLGLEFAGIVVEAGHAVKNLRVGDRVMGCKFADGALPSHIQMEGKIDKKYSTNDFIEY